MRPLLIAILFLSFTLLSGCTRISPGYEGIQVDLCADSEKDAVTPLPIGRHFAGWCEEIYRYPTYKTRYVFTADVKEQSENNEEICANDKDGMQHCFDVGVTVRTIKGKAGKVFASFRSYKDNMEGIVKGPLFDILRDSFNQVVRHYKASQIYAAKKGEIRDKIKIMYGRRLAKDGLAVDELTLNRYRPPAGVAKAIEAKVKVDEQAGKARAEAMKVKAEEQKKTITEIETAKRAKIRADAQAYVKITRANAQAKANERISKSISSNLIEYIKANKWDGKKSQVVGSGASTFFKLK